MHAKAQFRGTYSTSGTIIFPQAIFKGMNMFKIDPPSLLIFITCLSYNHKKFKKIIDLINVFKKSPSTNILPHFLAKGTNIIH
jgi:hypothetical protein